MVHRPSDRVQASWYLCVLLRTSFKFQPRHDSESFFHDFFTGVPAVSRLSATSCLEYVSESRTHSSSRYSECNWEGETDNQTDGNCHCLDEEGGLTRMIDVLVTQILRDAANASGK